MNGPRDAAIRRVEIASVLRNAADREIQAAVLSARTAGASWDELGRVLGISGSAVWQRYHQTADALGIPVNARSVRLVTDSADNEVGGTRK